MFVSLVNFSLTQRQIWTSYTMSKSYSFIRVKINYKRKLFCFYRQIVWLFCCAIIIDQEVTTKNSTWSLTPITLDRFLVVLLNQQTKITA